MEPNATFLKNLITMKIKAFTLIELLVVVAIIGALAAVGVIAYNGYTSAAKRNATLQNHSQAIKFIKVNLLNVNYRQAVLWSLAQQEQLIAMQKMMQAE